MGLSDPNYDLLKEYDEIVHIPMSSGLSGSCQSAMLFAQEYDGRVQVVNNQRISVTQRQSALDARLLVSKGMNAREIKDFLEAVETGRPFQVDGASARKSVALIRAIYESAASGRQVCL